MAVAGVQISKGRLVPDHAPICVVVMSTNSDPMTLTAVRSVLAPNVEVAVVNTGRGSLGNILAPVKDQIVLIESPKREFPGGTRNLGILNTSAPVVCFLAADCIALGDHVERRLAAHAAGNALVATCLRPKDDTLASWASYVFLHHKRMPERRKGSGRLFGLSYDRSLFEKYGLFDETLRTGEDGDFNERCREERSLWSPDILMSHAYPSTLSDACKDAYRRATIAGPQKSKPFARQALSGTWNGLRLTLSVMLGATRTHPRARLSSPLLLALTASNTAGLLSLYLRNPSRG